MGTSRALLGSIRKKVSKFQPRTLDFFCGEGTAAEATDAPQP
jgi:hypothetical protein